jgi:transcriptional regulator with XRE-family HTH domain
MPLTLAQLRRLKQTHVGASGNRVGAALELAEMTQAMLAEAIGVTQPYVSDVIRGRHATITLDNASRFSQFFGCSIEDLFPHKAAVAS